MKNQLSPPTQPKPGTEAIAYYSDRLLPDNQQLTLFDLAKYSNPTEADPFGIAYWEIDCYPKESWNPKQQTSQNQKADTPEPPSLDNSQGLSERDLRQTITGIDSPPSSTGLRRKRGEGTGHLFKKPITRKGKTYDQWWYQWVENGRRRSKYIPKKLLGVIKNLESVKAPLNEILQAIGEKGEVLNPVSSQRGLDLPPTDPDPLKSQTATQLLENKEKRSGTPSSPKLQCQHYGESSTLKRPRRKRGEGTGHLFKKPITRKGKTYDQWWYQWVEDGRRRCRYIPKKLLGVVQNLESVKAPLNEILEAIGEL